MTKNEMDKYRSKLWEVEKMEREILRINNEISHFKSLLAKLAFGARTCLTITYDEYKEVTPVNHGIGWPCEPEPYTEVVKKTEEVKGLSVDYLADLLRYRIQELEVEKVKQMKMIDII